ncbi:MAG: hypothetical protein ACI86M_001691, partial [Saprospiraceae bacterium]
AFAENDQRLSQKTIKGFRRKRSKAFAENDQQSLSQKTNKIASKL